MTILKLNLENFMNIEKASLKFEKGINVISGKNGSGKSAILMAIAFCLIDHRRGDSWKDYIQSGKTFFKINLSLLKSSVPNDVVNFSYEGGIKSGNVNKRIDYNGTTYLNSECNEFIKNSFDPEMLENIIFTLQDSKPVTHLTPLERRMIFKKIFNSNFQITVDKIKGDIDQKTSEGLSLRYEINALKSKSYPKMRLEFIDPQELTDLAKTQKDIEDQITKTSVDNDFRLEFQRNQDLLDKYVKPSFESAIAERDFLQNSIDLSLTKEIKYQKENQLLLESKDQKQEKIKLLETHISEIMKNNLDIRSNIEILEKEIENTSRFCVNIKVQHTIAKKHLETHKLGYCENCGQECEKSRLESLKVNVDKLNLERDVLDKDLKLKIENLSKLKEKHSIFIEFMNTDGNEKYRITSELNRITEDLESLESIFQNLFTERESQKQKLIIAEETLLLKIEELKTLEKWIQSNQVEKDLLEKSDLDNLNSLLNEVRNKINDLNQRITSRLEREILNKKLDDQIDLDLIRIQDLATKANDIDIDSQNLEFVKLFYETTFPNYINTNACALLENYMNNFLNTTKEDFQFKLQSTKKGIDFQYKATPLSDWLNVKLASGFETSLANLAFKSAVAFSYQAGLLVLDEPDAYSSETNSERLFETLTSINDGFDQMIIITHKSQAMEFFKEAGANIFKVNNGSFEENAD